ncbi:MAG: hypothetical protein Fur0032_23400 [Terrimicrobiaceae bacterium]
MGRRVIITCGPAIAPIDEVRRITNVSTGAIGTIMADKFLERGFGVLCLRGEGSTAPPPCGCQVEHFSTNHSLLDLLRRESGSADAVLHAAALCDYEVVPPPGRARKIRSDCGGIVIELVPAPKLLPLLRSLFPSALIVGWKFELDGSQVDALARGRAQLEGNSTDGCVVNGAAYGSGFGFLDTSGRQVTHWDDKHQLANGLAEWLIKKLSRDDC